MFVVPHVTAHKNGTTSAKLNVRPAGLNTDEVGLPRTAELLIMFAAQEKVEISRFALWFTDRTEKTNLTAAEAAKRLKAAIKENAEFSIEEEFGTTRDGRRFPERYAGRIRIGSNVKAAAPQSAAVAAFLKG
jgi:hypothetical protein